MRRIKACDPLGHGVHVHGIVIHDPVVNQAEAAGAGVDIVVGQFHLGRLPVEDSLAEEGQQIPLEIGVAVAAEQNLKDVLFGLNVSQDAFDDLLLFFVVVKAVSGDAVHIDGHVHHNIRFQLLQLVVGVGKMGVVGDPGKESSMSVVMIIIGSLVTALLAIGIVGGVILSGIAVARLIAGKGRFRSGLGKRGLLSGICLLNALALLVGGCFGVRAYQTHQEEIWSIVQEQAAQDQILPEFLK